MKAAGPDIVDIWADDQDLPAWFLEAMAVPREEAFVEVNGSRVHYFRWGTRGKPPLLMTHGFLAHARCFAFIAPFLAGDYDIIAYDLAGMGESEIPADCDNEARAGGMIALAEALDLFAGPAKPKIVAHSFGSGVALRAMEIAGDRFGGLIICDLMVMRPEKLAAHFSGGGGPPGSGRSWKFDPMVFHRNENDMAKWAQTPQRIVDLQHRMAIVYGEKSKLFDDDSAAFLRELGGGHIPMIAVPEAEHHLMLDQPLALVTALRSVLALWASE